MDLKSLVSSEPKLTLSLGITKLEAPLTLEGLNLAIQVLEDAKKRIK